MISPAASAAILEIRVIATAIVAIGHGSTVDEIATAAGLPRNTVMRRLRSSCAGNPRSCAPVLRVQPPGMHLGANFGRIGSSKRTQAWRMTLSGPLVLHHSEILGCA